MNPRIERIDAEIEKHKTKIRSLQRRVKQLERKRTELENLEIQGRVDMINATPDELAAIMHSLTEKGGTSHE